MCGAEAEYKLANLRCFLLFVFLILFLFLEGGRERELPCRCLPSFGQKLLRASQEIRLDDVFSLRRGQISAEHYRWLIMNDRLIKLI